MSGKQELQTEPMALMCASGEAAGCGVQQRNHILFFLFNEFEKELHG
jgi:hypothetical protein